jgi:DNA adenine methylase
MIKPLFKYTGSKWDIAPWIISHFPEHRIYVEPYCGSASVLLQKERSHLEILNDLSGSIVNLFRVIRERADELAAVVEMTPWSEEEYQLVEKSYTDGDELEQARRFLVRSWQAHGGTMYQVSGWKHNGLKGNVYPSKLWTKLPDRILAVVERLRGVEIRNREALEIIKYYDHPDVLLFLDPPYVLGTRNRKYYLHEMTDSEHIEMLELLNKHSGAIVLSGYDHPIYSERLKHWHKETIQTAGEHGKRHTEVLWMNFEPEHRQLELFGEEAV